MDNHLIFPLSFAHLRIQDYDMPRLVKGGKWIFGWTRVSGEGIIIIPPETLKEYGIHEGDEVILISGRKHPADSV